MCEANTRFVNRVPRNMLVVLSFFDFYYTQRKMTVLVCRMCDHHFRWENGSSSIDKWNYTVKGNRLMDGMCDEMISNCSAFFFAWRWNIFGKPFMKAKKDSK